MKKLNIKIKEKELEILEKEFKIEELKKEYEKLIAIETFLLELEYKKSKELELSNIEKRRTLSVEKVNSINDYEKTIIEKDKEILIDKIDLRFILREYHIKNSMNIINIQNGIDNYNIQ